MANERSNLNLFNPLLAWADVGLRAAEMTVASSQNINDAFDRVARAGAGADIELEDGSAGRPAASATSRATSRAAFPAALGQLGDWQRTMFEWSAQAWVNWMSALGSLASLPAGVRLASTVARQDNPLEAVRSSLRPAGWGEQPATEPQVGSMTYPSQRKRGDTPSDMQHALAAGDAGARRKPAAKRKGARRAARKSA